MTEFTINIKVTPIQIQLDATPAMTALAALLRCADGTATKEQPTAEAAQEADKPQAVTQQEVKKPARAKKTGAAKSATPPAAEDKAEPAAEDKTEHAEIKPAEDKPKELTAEDVRAAMHRTRQRIEGEDYKDNTESELYQKYHKELTRQFKNIAATLGADKPSALPEENRKSFIEQCDLLAVLENGEVGLNLPF